MESSLLAQCFPSNSFGDPVKCLPPPPSVPYFMTAPYLLSFLLEFFFYFFEICGDKDISFNRLQFIFHPIQLIVSLSNLRKNYDFFIIWYLWIGEMTTLFVSHFSKAINLCSFIFIN